MEREPILSTIFPPDDSQPLLTPGAAVTDDNENQEVDVVLRTFSGIPDEAITDINGSNDPHSTQSVVLLPASSSSIQANVIERTVSDDDEETPVDYQSLADDDESAALYDFLASLSITRQNIDHSQIPKPALLKLYQQEFSCLSWMKWSSLDHAIEKNLQWPLLSPTDVGPGTPQTCDYRVRPQERSILLQRPWGLMKAYAVRGLVQGVEMGLLTSVHYFIYAMLAYRLEELLRTGQTDFQEFQDVFSGSNQKGIDSLVLGLARLDTAWLNLILTAPLLLGVMQGLWAMRGARAVSAANIQRIVDGINAALAKSGSFWRNAVLEEVPLLSNLFSTRSLVQILERWVRWDGRLGRDSRQQAFELIRRTAREAKYIAQLNALESLAKITQGVGLKDFLRLQRAGWMPEDLAHFLYIKATALADLEALSQPGPLETGKAARLFSSLPRRVYAYYLLWWLGQSTSWFAQRLPFALLKTVKLTIEMLFLQKIIASVLEAVRCPDKPGFQFGNGYQDWASDYTAKCFTTRIGLFRGIDANESIDYLVAEISQYHLTELATLDLSEKYLTSEEASQIIQAVVQQGAPLQVLDLSANYLRELSEEMFRGLSQLTSLYLYANEISVLNEGVFSGLSQLTTLDLYNNQISVLSEGMFSGSNQLNSLDLGYNGIRALSEGLFNGLNQLNSLDLDSNLINALSDGVFSGLNQLNSLNLYYNEIRALSDGVFSGLSQLNSLDLDNNEIRALSDGVFNGLNQLITLSIYGNQINALSESVFSGLSQLNSLDLGYNGIRALSEGLFSGLSQLQTLDLSSNHLNTSNVISILSSLPVALTELDISSNQISTLPQNFSTLLPVGLESLSIGGNSFIPHVLTREFMQYFPFRLTTLGLEESFIVNIADDSFSDFSVLTTLDLDVNHINALSEGTFSGLSQLTTLSLFHNQISVLNEGMFNGSSQLTRLDLSGNHINALSEGVFSGLSQLTSLFLNGNQINALSKGAFSGSSQLTTLSLFDNQISVLSEGIFSGLSQLTSLDLSLNIIRVLSEGVFSGLSQLTSLILSDNQLNDTTIQNLTQNFPYQLNTLDVRYNQIGNDGMLALAEILPCTSLTYIYSTGNPANDTTSAIAVQQKILQKVCDDQHCHANLPATESCGVNTNPSTTGQMTWGLFDSVGEVDETESDLPDHFYWPHPAETRPFQTALALPSVTPESTSSLLTPAVAGAIIFGVAGLSVLLYKNSTWMQAIVSTGSRLFQRCWNNGKIEKAKTTFPANSSNRRYTLFPHLPAFLAQRISTITIATDMTPR